MCIQHLLTAGFTITELSGDGARARDLPDLPGILLLHLPEAEFLNFDIDTSDNIEYLIVIIE